MPTKFIKDSREFHDVSDFAEDHATAMNIVKNDEVRGRPANQQGLRVKQQNRDTETYVSDIKSPVDDYYNTKTDPPFRSAIDQLGEKVHMKYTETRGGDGHIIHRGGSGIDSTKPDYASTPYGRGNYDYSSSTRDATGKSNSNSSPRPGVVYKGSSTKGMVPSYKKYTPKK